MSDLLPNPFDSYVADSAYRFDPAAEATFKGIELRATRITVRRGHDRAEHSYLDVPGGNVEVTGRRSYIVEMDTVWTGANWQERLANAIWVHDTGADVAGELAIPFGPVIDAKWVEAPDEWAGKNAKTMSCTFIEEGHAASHFIQTPNPRSVLRSSIPDEDTEILLPLVEDYTDAIDAAGQDSLAVLIEMLVRVDNAAYLAQQALDVSSSAGWSRYMLLGAVRANAIRAFPSAYGVDLSSVLR
jgi:hypothetical protein